MNFSRQYVCFIILQTFLVLLIWVQAHHQEGFISIDCGSSGTYTDETSTISYSSDEGFIETGESRDISPEYKKGINDSQLFNVRSFPQGIRNCYTLKPEEGKGHKYLIRARFLYGNYDGNNKAPSFEVYLGPDLWDTMMASNSGDNIDMEILHVPSSDYINVCLVNIGHGIPFISALELRPLDNEVYLTPAGTSLQLYNRYDFSAVTDQKIRYEDDHFDRLWSPFKGQQSINISSKDEDSIKKNKFVLPYTVMSTALTAKTSDGYIKISLSKLSTESRYIFYMHFTELEKLISTKKREFNMYINDELAYGPISPLYLDTNSFQSGSGGFKADREGKLTIWLNSTSSGAYSVTVPPIINAMEVFVLKELPQKETNQIDVEAISKVKLAYGLKKVDWQGDPCVPIVYLWGGLNCSYTIDNQPRIVSLTLSSSGLEGEIDPSIAKLSMLEYLDLSHNKLDGKVPQVLADLKFLKFLNLEGNNFTDIPRALRSKKDLVLRIDQNYPSTEKKKSFIVPVIASLSGALLILLVILVIIWKIKNKRKQNVTNVKVEPASTVETSSSVFGSVVSVEHRNINDDEQFGSKSQQYTYSEILKITSNFERVLGEGGFGKVYHGILNDKEVAVKMLSSQSIQGHRQFFTELKLLLRVHHKNLTALVGYCNEESNVGLIYEYMAMGNLRSHLSGTSKSFLSWEDRLRIAIDTAQGLDYLHNGCKPPIIHRDVKSTNILLNENRQAKLGDFGLSKIFPLDGGFQMTEDLGITTSIAGTPGYLDPEYYTTNWLNEKSDVYSFGVVLLEIVTARPVLTKTRENSHIIQRVSAMLAMGDIANILDPELEGYCDINTVWKAIEIAMACVSRTSTNRPTMSRVCTDLKECLMAELTRKDSRDVVDFSKDSSVDMISRIMITQYSPNAR